MLTTRRQAIKTLAAATLGTSLAQFSTQAADTNSSVLVMPGATPAAPEPPPTGPYTMPPLPYGYGGLEPMIDAQTVELHYTKHHAAYVAKLNEAVAKVPSLAKKTNLEEMLKNLSAVPESIRTAVRNNGGGHYNHSLMWQTFSPHGGGFPPGDLTMPICNTFVSFEKFRDECVTAANGLFGSGWVWLVLDHAKKLSVMTTPNQDSPLSVGKYPLFGIDVWEHAYYLKYHNVRSDYISALWNVVDWVVVTKRYGLAMQA